MLLLLGRRGGSPQGLNFPTGPTVGQTYRFVGRVWTWNGEGWLVASKN